MQQLKHICVLSDGRPGHENQSIGLALALQKRSDAKVEVRMLNPHDNVFGRVRTALSANSGKPGIPDLLIGAGHRTHLPLWYSAFHYRSKSVVLMKPSLPTWVFDLCLIPRHDLGRDVNSKRVVTTRGALNRIPEEFPTKENRALVLMGGPSKHHGWDSGSLVQSICDVVRSRPDLHWVIGDSRRTPEGAMRQIRAAGLAVELVPFMQTSSGWLPDQLMRCQEAWVTEDSVSMIHEAVTAGARTGVLSVPRNKSKSRVFSAVSGLIESGHAVAFEDWQVNGHMFPAVERFHETARCAELIMQRWFTGQSRRSS